MDRRRLGAIGAGLLILALAVPVGTMARDSRLSKFQRLDVSHVDTSLLNILNPKTTTKVVIELAGRPVALHTADARALGRTLTKDQKAAVRAGLKATQDKLVPQLTGLGAKVLGQYQDAYNGIKVQVAAGQVAKISQLAGVVGVHKVSVYQPDNTNTVPFLGAPTAWDSLGYTGAGVKVGIIDTGIDYYHANFGGSGDPDEFAAADGLGTDGVFPTAKVAGGYDFVGDDYNAATGPGYQPVPHPDSDPLDCNGHGSHVAGTTAGFGVLGDGSTYDGSYDTTTVGSNTWTIGPGVAPEATLYAYRVFGCDGSTDVVVDAINKAVEDGMDVINMSLGSPFGQVDDPDAVASDNAALAGVVVVASAGNAGSLPMITGGPSSGNRVIAVAAQEGVAGFAGANIDIATVPSGINANGATIGSGITGNIHVLLADPTHIALGCSASDYASVVPGEIVVTKRGTCARVDRATYGQAAGAAAVIMVNNATDLPPFEGDIPGVTIPFIGFSSSTEAAFIAADGEEHTLTATTIANPSYKKVASFSSGGPREYDNALKPDVSAPGVSVLSTAVGTGWKGERLSGTSMASPATAGVAALVVDAHPGWTPEQVKAAMMNTADATSAHMASYNIRTAGAGTVQADKAIQTVALATTGGGTSSLSFGYDPNNGAYSETKPITITNTSNATITYTFGVDWNAQNGAVVSFSPTSVKVPAHGSKNVNVKLSLSNAAMTSLPAAQDIASTSLLTIRGTVKAIPTAAAAGRYTLRVPFLAVPRPLSNITPGLMTPYSLDGSVASATVPLSNTGIHYGAADVYAWGLSDGNDGLPMSDIRAVGLQVFSGSDPFMVFAINTWGRFGNPAAAEWDIAIDANGNGYIDHYVVGYDYGALTTGSFSGQLASVVMTSSGHVIAAYGVGAPINGSTVELPVYASDLGITGSQDSYYIADTVDLISGAYDETADYAGFDAFDPAVSQGDWFDMNRWDTASLPVWADVARLGDLPAYGWMVVTLDDANGAAQADLVPFGTLPSLP